MSDGELSRLEVLRDMDQRRLTTEAAAQLLGLERRQVFRLLKAYRSEGATGLISKRRGRPSNRGKPKELRDKALAIIREQYWDFGPTLAAEKLRAGHGIALGRETLRLWMIGAGIWADRKQRRKHVHQPAIAASASASWCKSTAASTGGSRTARAAMHAARVHRRCDQPADAASVCPERVDLRLFPRPLAPIWKPVAFYSDKHGVFRATIRGRWSQFGRALHALNIDIICANSSQAKGRVERAPKTLQDRLVKELRLAGVATLAAGNALLPAFTAHYNARFVKPPAHEKDLHRPLRAGDDLEDAFAWKDERTLSQALTTAIRQGDLHPGAERAGQGGDRQAGNRHRLSRWPAGDPSQEPAPAKTGGVELAYRTFDKMRQGRSGCHRR